MGYGRVGELPYSAESEENLQLTYVQDGQYAVDSRMQWKPAGRHDSELIRSISEAARVEVGGAVMLCGRVRGCLQKSLKLVIGTALQAVDKPLVATGELTFVFSQVEGWMACS